MSLDKYSALIMNYYVQFSGAQIFGPQSPVQMISGKSSNYALSIKSGAKRLFFFHGS